MRRKYLVPMLLILMVFATKLSAIEKDMEGSFSFVVLGHVTGHADGRINPLLDELLTEALKLDPDMVFLTGDMIRGGIRKGLVNIDGTFYAAPVPIDSKAIIQDWERLDAMLGQLGVPIYRVPGNHDMTYPATRDIYFARYGELPQAITYGGSLFILLNSSPVPQGDRPAPYKYVRGKPLDSRQINFIWKELSEDKPYSHVFLFMHHLLWWNEDAPWWLEVHPLLAGRNVRAVFGGDNGPMKFSHMRRDGIDYIQSGIEDYYSIDNPDSLWLLRNNAGDREMAQQFDNFLYVTVDGPQVTIEVKAVGAISSGKFSPQRFRMVHGDVGHRPPKPETTSTKLVKRAWELISTPKRLVYRRLVALTVVMGFCFLSGVAVALAWKRWRAA